MPSFSNTLEQAIHSALALANSRSHEFATLEHLLLALIDEPDAVRVMKACSVDTEELRTTLVDYIDDDLSNLVTDIEGSEAVPTAAFQRVIQRAAIHVQSSSRSEVTGANVLVAIFNERESHAAFFLQELFADFPQFGHGFNHVNRNTNRPGLIRNLLDAIARGEALPDDGVDVDALSPREALNVLYDLKSKVA